MDRERIEAIRAARGGARSTRSANGSEIDARALAMAHAKLRNASARGTARALDADELRALAASLRARMGA